MNLHEIAARPEATADEPEVPARLPHAQSWPFFPEEPPRVPWVVTPPRYTNANIMLSNVPANPFYETMTYPAAGYARRSIPMSRRFALSSLSTRLEAIRDTANIMISLAIAHPGAFGWRVRAESDPMSDMVIVEWNQYE